MICIGKLTENLMKINVEELRTEFCIEFSYIQLKYKTTQIRKRLHEIEEMLDKQLEVHKDWDGFIKRRRSRDSN